MTLPPRPADHEPDADPAPAVERALAELDGIADRPLADHVAVFERIHGVLGEALAGSSGEPAGRA